MTINEYLDKEMHALKAKYCCECEAFENNACILSKMCTPVRNLLLKAVDCWSNIAENRSQQFERDVCAYCEADGILCSEGNPCDLWINNYRNVSNNV
jgi:hypothetical protein